MTRLRIEVATAVLVLLVASCADPLKDAEILALGGEVPGVEEGEFHRPGQPCLVCHSVYGGAEPRMSIGGTVYFKPSDQQPYPVGAITVRLVDSEGEARERVTNCIGNFFITKDEWDPAFPLRVELLEPLSPDAPDELRLNATMFSRIAREGSCAGCHTHPASAFSPGVVFVTGDPADYPVPSADCAGLP